MSQNAEIDPTTDPASPYLLDPTDFECVLVQTPFTGKDFHIWKRLVTISLSAKNKLGFVDGTITPPDSTSPTYNAWQRNNCTLLLWFLKVLDPTIGRSVLYSPTARALWTDLEERYGRTSALDVYILTRKLADIEQGTDSIATFYNKIKALWNELDAADPLPVCSCGNCTCGISEKLLKRQEEQRMISFLMKLNSNYTEVRSTLLMQQPLPTILHAYRLLVHAEKLKEMSANSSQHDSATNPPTLTVGQFNQLMTLIRQQRASDNTRF